MVAWRLLGVPGTDAYRRRLDTPLVGRRDELAQLRHAYARSVSQRSCALFTVIGPAGIGKSRLTLEFLRSVRDEATVLRGRCLPYGEGITYWPLVEIGRRIAGGGEDDLRALIGDEHDAEPVAAALASVIGRSQTPVSIDDAGWAVRRLFESLARERPLVVSFEDVNWAEPTLLDLIEHIAEWTRDAPVMLVCTAREELIEQRPTWAGGLRNAATAFLEPLSDGDSAELVEQLGGELAAAGDTVSRVVALSGGNPLFVEQLLATMGSEQQPDVGALSTIHAVIGARLDALSPVERELLECASVIGKEFWPEPVYAAMREDPKDTLSELMRKDLVRHARSAFHGQAAYRFGHLLVRDAAYARIPKRRRAELHERFVAWMDTADPGEEPEIADVIGYHLEQAHRLRAELGPPDEAARALATRAGGALAEAGSRAQRRMDAPAAANLLSRAAALYADERPARLELLPELALAQLLIGELERARGTLDEALSTSIELADRRNEQRALMGHAVRAVDRHRRRHPAGPCGGTGDPGARAGGRRSRPRPGLAVAGVCLPVRVPLRRRGGGARAGAGTSRVGARHRRGARGVRQPGADAVAGAGAGRVGDHTHAPAGRA